MYSLIVFSPFHIILPIQSTRWQRTSFGRIQLMPTFLCVSFIILNFKRHNAQTDTPVSLSNCLPCLSSIKIVYHSGRETIRAVINFAKRCFIKLCSKKLEKKNILDRKTCYFTWCRNKEFSQYRILNTLSIANTLNARSDTTMNFHVSIACYHSRYTRLDVILAFAVPERRYCKESLRASNI